MAIEEYGAKLSKDYNPYVFLYHKSTYSRM